MSMEDIVTFYNHSKVSQRERIQPNANTTAAYGSQVSWLGGTCHTGKNMNVAPS